jgi:hypothetical protein
VHNKRKSSRRPYNREVWLDFGDQKLRVCRMLDISEGGARISLDEPKSAPAHVVLHFKQGGLVARKCRVVWRSDTEIGVQFLARLEVTVRRPDLPAGRDRSLWSQNLRHPAGMSSVVYGMMPRSWNRLRASGATPIAAAPGRT